VAGSVEPPVDPEAEARAYLQDSARNASSLLEGDLPVLAAKAGGILAETIRGGGTVLFCGNGGSAADAQHLAAELVGRLDAGRDRDPLPGLALTTDTSALTAVSNDFGFEEVFARQIRGLGRPSDALVCLSTSGRSPNVLRAADAARSVGLRVVALVGPSESPLDDVADVSLHVPGGSSGHIQQGHITLGHLLCRLAETG
jgi:D-sedoheptulose 7-phosphate isomerase